MRLILTRPPNARQFNVWLSPEDHQTLEDYRYAKRLRNKSEALRVLLKQVRSWLGEERRAAGVEHDDEERDDLADDVGPDYVPRTASGIEIDPDCPEMAALEDL